MFTQVAQMCAIPCTAAGVNSLTLTPIGSAPAFTSYQNFTAARFVATANSTAAVSAQFGSLANLPVYLSDGITQVTTQIISGQEYVLVFALALNSGLGGFYLESPAATATIAAAGGVFTNLFIINNATFPNTQLAISYDELVMNNPAGSAIRAVNQSLNLNAATSGVANGLDTGALAPAGWYYSYGISNGIVAASLLSLSSTTPTMPTGYSFRKRLGSIRTDLSGNLLPVRQRQHQVQWATDTGLNYPNIATGISSGGISLTGFVPPTAVAMRFRMTATNGVTQCGPNTTVQAQNYALVNAAGVSVQIIVDMVVEIPGPTVFYAGTAAGSALDLVGWTENN